MFGDSTHIEYMHHVEGIWGQFETPAGAVNFIQTKARLSLQGIDPESRLTSLLCPVREVLDIAKMDFNQLLQRDLDDHRVATELLPYIIEPSLTGPAFFPPIVAALLPFNANLPIHAFPERQDVGVISEPAFGNAYFVEQRYGSAYRFQRMTDPHGADHRVRFGRLGWNDEQAKLVVLDGQHRAMALLAIVRTLKSSWEQSSGSKYRHFYEHRINAFRKELKKVGRDLELDRLQFPVTVCWFPEYHGPSRDPHVVARKLFVDVNKTARAPSEARLILLSDTDLLNIFTRALLNRLRENDDHFPLFAIEYDNPVKDSATPTRWSVIANLNMLRNGIERSVFGPARYHTNMATTFGGRPNEGEMDAFMRGQIDLKDVVPDQIDDGDDRILRRDQIGRDNFPIYNKTEQEHILKAFLSDWGEAILTLLGGLLPFKAHLDAITEMQQTWLTDDSVGSLAYEAIFQGVGMYWTLRDSNLHWEDRVQKGETSRSTPPDVVKAWQVIQKKGEEFSVVRASKYLGRTNDDAVKSCDELFKTVNTHACQIGVIMTLATLQHFNRTIRAAHLAPLLVEAWNTVLATGPVKSRDRRLLLSRRIDKPLNQITKMDTPLAVFFRYFWLEMLCVPIALAKLDGKLDQNKLFELRDAARAHYVAYLIKEKGKAFQKTNATWTPARRKKEAEATVRKELGEALKYWLEVDKSEFEGWFDGPRVGSGLAFVEEGEQSLDEGETNGSAEEASSDEGVERLLRFVSED